jgi:hypothetical protein
MFWEALPQDEDLRAWSLVLARFGRGVWFDGQLLASHSARQDARDARLMLYLASCWPTAYHGTRDAHWARAYPMSAQRAFPGTIGQPIELT